MTLPTNIGYGRVVGQWLKAVGDGNDPDSTPDGVPAGGKVTFTPSVARVANASAVPNPVTIIPTPVVCQIDSDGYLVDPQNNRGVWLVATDDTDNNPAGWTYSVKLELTGLLPQTFNISVAEGATADLSLVAPVVSSSGASIVRGPSGPSAFDTAVANGFVGTESEWLGTLEGPKGDPGPGASDADLAARANDPASQFRAALSATYAAVWKPNTAYAAGARVLNPSGDIVLAKVAFTSGAAYDPANWTLPSTYAPRIPYPTRRPLPGVSMVSAMQAGHGWASAGPGTWDLNNTADFALGSQSIKLTTDTGSANNTITLTGLTLDMTGKGFVLWVKVVGDITKLGYVTIDAGNTGLTTYFRGQPFNFGGLKEPIKAGEWLPLLVPWAEMETSKAGAPSRAAINAIRLNYAGQATALDIYTGGIGTYVEDTAYPNGVVSLTFDDSFAAQWSIARPKMSAMGYAGTLFPILDLLDTAGRLTTAQVRTLYEVNGWEIAAHAATNANHVDLTTLSAATLAADLQAQRDWLDSQGYTSRTHAYPSGPFNASVAAAVAKHFATSRGTIRHANTPLTALPFRLESLVASNSGNSLLANLQSYIDQIAAGKSWGILTFHDFIPSGTPGNNTWTQADFNTLMDYIATKGVAVRTVGEVMKTTR